MDLGKSVAVRGVWPRRVGFPRVFSAEITSAGALWLPVRDGHQPWPCRHVGDLFQVCLFALYHLKLARISPAIGLGVPRWEHPGRGFKEVTGSRAAQDCVSCSMHCDL